MERAAAKSSTPSAFSCRAWVPRKAKPEDAQDGQLRAVALPPLVLLAADLLEDDHLVSERVLLDGQINKGILDQWLADDRGALRANQQNRFAPHRRADLMNTTKKGGGAGC
eukprot:6197082-Pleurochrysis_carterae.AAC.2